MPVSVINEDLRSIKTEKALYAALCSLLKTTSFRKITIKGICEKALISRATFYAHYIDKYDLLKRWMEEIWPKDMKRKDCAQLETMINSYINENAFVLKNIVSDADRETFGILFDFILSTTKLNVDRSSGEEAYSKNIVFSNFYAGGIISYLLWQVNNRFSQDIPFMNSDLYKMIHALQGWQSEEG